MTKPLYFWNGSSFELVGPTTPQSPFAYQTSAPTAPATGDIWIDSDGDVDTYNRQLTRYYFVASAGQTSVSGTDANGLTLAYVAGSEQVYVNGALQVRGVDYTATNGTSITNLSALALNDVVEVFAYTAFTVANAYTKSETDGLIQAPYRNLIINGAMQVAQRATSVSGITSTGYWTADRWAFMQSSLGTWTNTVENDAPTGSGFRKSFKLLCTTADASPAASDYAVIIYQAEGQDLQRIKKGTAAAEQLTLSFWVKSNVTGNHSIMLYDNDNARFVSFTYSITVSGTWEKKTITIPADTTGAFDNDNQSSLQLYFNLGAGSSYTGGAAQTTWSGSAFGTSWMPSQTNVAAATNNYFQLTGVQLEIGSVATPYEFKPYAQDLAQCQRYYFLLTENNDSGSGRAIGNAAMYASNSAFGAVHFPVQMRINPIIRVTTGTDYYGIYRNGGLDTFNSFTLNQAGNNVCIIYNNSEISGTAGHAGWFVTNNTLAKLAFDSEL